MSGKFIDNPKFARVLKKVVAALRPWRWCLIGGRAVEVWTNPPQTPDIDVLVELTDFDANTVVQRMRQAGISLKSAWEGLGVPILFMRDDALKVAVDVAGAFETFHNASIAAAKRKTIGGVTFRAARPEHLVLLKAQAATAEGRGAAKRARDRAAIRALFDAGGVSKSAVQNLALEYGLREEAALLRFMRLA